MKKYTIRIACFILTFAVGFGLADLLQWAEKTSRTNKAESTAPNNVNQSADVPKRGAGLEVRFREIINTENGLVADFEITNHGAASYFYSSYEENDTTGPFFALYQVKLNGKKENLGWCGTGLQSFALKSNETKIFRVHDLSRHWEKGVSLQYGFLFRRNDEQKPQTYWSGEIPIDEAAARLLIAEKENFNRSN
ncbi:MAG TPA: hypothetical protein VIL74_20230 [Pyrinomonadaceae bacterium]|jgi:hypothetical protein